MCNEKTCYFCKFLCFFDTENAHEYYCTITCRPCRKTLSPEDCMDFAEDREE